ncbi:uncharacterized protein LOC121737276 isoform X3 [Aricia agestis]|uniref:uncharacterized protein LOC121737276 isoform X3 n=1 Tax=Aricia agestis TaxID=91739 RepID=UPI001C20A0D4|nr:uncharacterized protein LOC121737276 isoform X3 [Aricia agestis]
MANDEVLGPRKTMFVLVIVVGCFAVLWPRILSPLIVGHSREQLKPNQFDREAGCCEVIFEPEVAVLELVNELCSSAIGKMTPQAAIECRKAVNDTCGVDIAALVKQKENVGKTMKMLVETMKNSNSSCLRNNFGVPIYSLSTHFASNSWSLPDTVKQERPPIRMGPHPAMRERGRAIPPGAPPPSKPVALPPHLRVRSPLNVYYELDIKPPPIPGMRPPLGSPGGPVPAPKSSMGFVMPIYTICIIVFFVYTLSKILFKRTGSPYEPVPPDPHFRRRVFRDDSRNTPDKLEDAELAALKARLAETERAMQRIVSQLAQRDADALDNTRPYTNGSIVLNSGPVHIITSEHQESKEKTPEPQKPKEPSPEPKESDVVTNDYTEKDIEYPDHNKVKRDLEIAENLDKGDVIESKEKLNEHVELEQKSEAILDVADTKVTEDEKENDIDLSSENREIDDKPILGKESEDLIAEEKKLSESEAKPKESTPELLEEALKEESPTPEEIIEAENESSRVKVVGMEMTADGGVWPIAPPTTPAPHRPHEADEVKSIFLPTEIPHQSRVLVSDFAEDRAESPKPANNAPLVVSGKMTLSLIQDAPRETPERDPESTVDDFTTASAFTQQQALEKEDDLSDEEIEEVEEIEEIEVEEIEEEVEVEEIEEEVEEEEEE